MATIKDVAKLAGVSFKTVSRVINGVSTVDAELHDRVQAAIKQLDYQPNLSARHLRGRPTSIAFIYDNPNSHYVIELQKGILRECRERGYELVIHPCDSADESIYEELMRLARRVNVGGLILTPPLSEHETIVSALVADDIPFVRIISGSRPPDRLSPCVYIDDQHAARDITSHLIDNGHHRIAFLGGDTEHRSSAERLEGYRSALRAKGMSFDPELVVDGRYSFQSGIDRTEQLLALADRPTAIFACNDEIAAGTLYAARMAGVAVPGELSIAGFEDSPFSRQTWPNMTTAHQSNVELATTAARLLIDAVNARHEKDGSKAVPASFGIQPVLIVRGSTGPAAKP
ncbi:MAG: LacI family DNA-binding transcriptional regulator [Pseudomonadota bacterium]